MSKFVLCLLSIVFYAIPLWGAHLAPSEVLRLRRELEMPSWQIEERRAVTKEKYVLPVSRPYHQAESGLCWVYATLNAIETNYLVQHPEVKLELSRASMQYFNWEDRYLRKILYDEDLLEEGGTPIDALAILRRRGMVALTDYPETPKTVSWHDPFSLAGGTKGGLVQSLYSKLNAVFGEPPQRTHFQGRDWDRRALSEAILGNEVWEAYGLAKDGVEGYRKHFDPDARRESLAWYLPEAKFFATIKRSLQTGNAVDLLLCRGHDIMLYGAEYDEAGKARLYYVKDNYDKPFYALDPDKLAPYTGLCGITTRYRAH